MLSQAQKQVSRKVLGADAASEVAQTAESTKKLHTSAAASAIGSLALVGICTLAFSVRLFSVIKYESVIHEFDPYFNYRVTQFLTKHGFYELWNWFDDLTWYPLGRVIGGTVYPGLIYTAGIMWNVLHFFNIPLHVQEVCVFTAPLFSSLCALATYLFVKEIKGQGAGLLASAFVATVPSYISRSVAGSYDNEGVAIFALVFTFYLYVKTINTGSLSWATANALAYWYMVLSWGGYTFIINLLPIHCLACVFLGRLNSRVYVAFAPLIVLGTIEAASIPVVGFNAVLMSEHFGAFFAFLVLHAAMGIKYIKGILPEKTYQSAKILALTVGIGGVAVAITLMVGYVAASPTFGWTGRSLSLLDPTYASKYIPIIASVSEHQPPTWSSYFTDINVMVLLMPLGLLACFRPLTDSSLFLILYGVTAAYFSGVMVRLMLVLAPAACCLAGIAADEIMRVLAQAIRAPTPAAAPATSGLSTSSSLGSGERSRLDKQVSGGKRGKVADRKDKDKRATPVIDWLPPTLSCAPQRLPHCWQPVACYAAPVAPVLMLQWREDKKASSEVDRLLPALARAPQRLPRDLAACGLLVLAAMLITYMFHCCWVSADMYSAPSIVLQSRGRDGQLHVFDDFREAYAWLRHNTEEDAKIASWWDYGYQTTAMANRTVLVDNNTWNNTHIATVGRAMASPEKQAWTTFKALDTKYVLVVFGGFIGYPSDDINKFLWMVRIGGGVFPDIKEADYLGPRGYTIDDSAGKAMLDSIMYKMCYYRFADAAQMVTGQYGFDRVRNTPIGVTDVKLRYFEEVFTSEHWMVRIYAVKDQPSTDIKLRNPRRSKSIVKRPRTGRAVVAPW